MSASQTPKVEDYKVLSATYQSPTNAAFRYEQKLASPATSSTSGKVTYLSTLRKATKEMQQAINKDLTQRMDDDKEATKAGVSRSTKAVDEAKEEDNYGEEVPEEDD